MAKKTAPISDVSPLTGLRGLDLSHVIAGPFATLYLAQLSAEVTKVEKPGGGKVMRASPRGIPVTLLWAKPLATLFNPPGHP